MFVTSGFASDLVIVFENLPAFVCCTTLMHVVDKRHTYSFSLYGLVNLVNFSEVEAANQPAVQLYRKFGFETQENPNWRSKNIFMVKDL